MHKEIKPSKQVNKLTDLPDKFIAFSKDEVRAILDAFQQDKLRSKYYPFFCFKFNTGCRPGEAIALTWNDIKFEQGVVLFNKTYDDKVGLTEGTKTEDCRTFPMSDGMKDWLLSLKLKSSSRLVFPGNNGSYLASSTIGSAWGNNRGGDTPKGRPGVVVELVKKGKIAQYLSMYHTRHTFINNCIDRGVDTITIADWCGNSDNIIQQAYRSRNRNVDINKQLPMLQ